MKRILLFLSLYCCTESCQSPFNPDLVVVESEIDSLTNQPEEGYIINQGTFDLGAETFFLGNRSGRLPQICNLAIYFRPHQYITHLGGRYPTLFFLIKDVYPNDNPDHFIFERGFQLEFMTDEPCGDTYDLLEWYTGPWDNKHTFLAAVLHPSLATCWPEGTFSFWIATNFPLECPG